MASKPPRMPRASFKELQEDEEDDEDLEGEDYVMEDDDLVEEELIAPMAPTVKHPQALKILAAHGVAQAVAECATRGLPLKAASLDEPSRLAKIAKLE